MSGLSGLYGGGGDGIAPGYYTISSLSQWPHVDIYTPSIPVTSRVLGGPTLRCWKTICVPETWPLLLHCCGLYGSMLVFGDETWDGGGSRVLGETPE